MGNEILNNLGVKIVKSVSNSDKVRELSDWGILSESALDPIRKVLAKDVWNDDKIKPKHRKYILDTLSKWLKKMGVDKEPSAVAIIGSITTYQYADNSDIDVNVVIDVSESELDELLSFLPNEIPLPGTKHPVNYYLAKDAGENVKGKLSVYDLLNNKWIKRAKASDITVPHSYVLEIAKFFMAGIDNRIAEYERDKQELVLYEDYLKDKEIEIDVDELEPMIETKKIELKADLDSLYVALKMVKAFRGKAYEEDYESDFLISIESTNRDFSINNLVYKTIERFGYLDKLIKYKRIREEE